MITNILKPTIETVNIELTPYRKDLSSEQNALWMQKNASKMKELGKDPLVWYNGIYIPPYLIDSFMLSTNEFCPSLHIVFRDETKQMVNLGFALDNTIISLYIDSRTKDASGSSILRPIRMDFKIIDFDFDDEENLFRINGIPNIDGLYIQRIKSYTNMTSYDTLKALAKDMHLGFNSNIQNTTDNMNWLNFSLENHTFIKDVTKRAYKSDNSFFDSFIDFYYNLNFIDVEQCFKESLDIKGVLTSSEEGIEEDKSQIVDDLYITSSKYLKNRYNNLYESFTIHNNSTKVSLDNGYTEQIHYYDKTGNWKQKGGTFLRFDLQTNTDGKGIILKSSPNDVGESGFFKRNTKKVYVQPLDVDNTHKNFNFAFILNEYNKAEIDKIQISVIMRTPNYNFYKFQKIKVYVMNPVLGEESTMNERLTGGWLIKEINLIYDTENGMSQELIMSKRELSAGDFNF
jgi:hypothetical protein